jgi:hypothetical protein
VFVGPNIYIRLKISKQLSMFMLNIVDLFVWLLVTKFEELNELYVLYYFISNFDYKLLFLELFKLYFSYKFCTKDILLS